jgi:hypothetical protein
MSILLLTQKALIDKVKNNLINDDNNSIDNHTHFMEQAFNKPYPSMECKCIQWLNYKIPQNEKLVWVWWDIHKNPENKLPFHKFSTKLHM